MDNINAAEGSILVGINSNFGDTATLTNIVASGVDDVCVSLAEQRFSRISANLL